jgi:repressor LexA
MKDLTEKQRGILEYIYAFTQNQGYPPTIREIADRFEITPKGAYDHLKAIEKKGYIKCEKNRSRAIDILRMPDGSLPATAESTVRIPLVGRVAAGTPILAEENIEEYLTFPKAMVKDENIFALRVQGDSMVEAGIRDGDIAVIKKANTADNGDIVVALIDDEATLKYFYKEKTRIRLEPANAKYRPIYTTHAMILGRLSGLYRQFA